MRILKIGGKTIEELIDNPPQFDLPGTGKLSIRYVHSRFCYQAYCGRLYIDGASGTTEEEVIGFLKKHFKESPQVKALP